MNHRKPVRAFGRGAAAPALARAPLGWHRGGALVLLCSALVLAASAGTGEAAAPKDLEWQALGIAPLSSGGRTGLPMEASDAVQPIDIAPVRKQLDLRVTLGTGESVGALLVRAGAHRSDAIAADTLVRSARARPEPGSEVDLSLGTRSSSGDRQLDRLRLKAGLGLQLEIRRGEGGLDLIRHSATVDSTPLRIRGRAGDGLYWALRTAGASPHSAAEYLQAIAAEVDVGGEIARDDRFDLVIARRRVEGGDEQVGPLLYAGLDRSGAPDLQLVRWRGNGRAEWINANDIGRPSAAAIVWPTSGRITSGFGYRVHPILRFARLHRGVDFGAAWGSPIVAAADGRVTATGWAGGYGRQVRIIHADGLATSYSHMSSIVAEEGGIVRRGELIGYVGSSGLSTGPHLHFEVHRNGEAVNPLVVRFASSGLVDAAQAQALKARLKSLLAVGTRRS